MGNHNTTNNNTPAPKVEAPVYDNQIWDASGWQIANFKGIPYVDKTQRGVVAKGDISHALFSTIQLREDFEDESVRKAISKIPILTNDLLAKDPSSRLVSLVGIDAELWKQWDPAPPKEIRRFDEKKSRSGDTLFPAKIAEIFLMVKSHRVDFCFELTKLIIFELGSNVAHSFQYSGFRYMEGRDLSGFIDGTRNPDHMLRALVDQVVIFPDDDGKTSANHVGGTYMYAGRFVHNLAKFASLSHEEKNQTVGRDLATVKPHEGFDKRLENPRLENASSKSHAQRAFGSMYRQAYPYVSTTEQGLFFTAYARSLKDIDSAINRMCGHEASDGSIDNLFMFTKNAESYYFYVPSLTELENLPNIKSSHGKYAKDGKEEIKTTSSNETKKIKVFIEFCTNCGYKSIFLDKKKALEALDPNIEVIGNPEMPRLSAFEVTLEDGTVLWSKLSMDEGKQNVPRVFPTDEEIMKLVGDKYGLKYEGVKLEKAAIYQEGTSVGVW